ncbi:MAG: penicillin-binding transpeptidase domain-containing protein [Anaerolineales bacterium]
MKKIFLLILLLITLGGCNKSNPDDTQMSEFTPTPGLATPVVQTTQTPDVEATAVEYLNNWKESNFQAMYQFLDSPSQTSISEEDFTQLHHDFAVELALETLEYRILSSFMDPTQAQVAISVDYVSHLIDELSRDIIMMLSLADGEWRIKWAKTLIFPELEGDNQLQLTRIVPSRGNIYDREGSVIVAYAEAISLGITPSHIDLDREEDLLEELGRDLDMPPEVIAAMYADFPPDVEWYIPLGALSMDTIEGRLGILESYTNTGLLLRTFDGRYYFGGGAAPQAMGYVRWIQEAEEDDYRILGYSRDEKVGGQGLENWGETYLAGDRGGILYMVDGEGEILSQLARSEAGPASEIYTTIDKEFQLEVQKALYGYNGAIVVIELDTGRVLAMVSNPHFDPNAFNSNYYNSSLLLQEYYKADRKTPFLNRATQGLYPLGSVFKIITMAAGLESGEFQAGDIYDCGYFFEELGGVTLTDWTYDHFLEDDETPPSGVLTLTEGLMRSCNPYFWHIGLDLYRKGLTDAISEMARGFGLGSVTGIGTIEEEAGNIPVPRSELDATNLAIGQGESLVTPLQVAQFMAAIGNGGTIYRPQFVESIRSSGGEEVFSFEPVQVGELPISSTTLNIIKNAMVQVVENPRGTANHRIRGLQIPVAGKTGSAESGSGESHAWFAGYTNNQNENKPDIAVVVIAENAGEGSDVAAPIFRRVVELYFNQILRYYPWEAEIGVWYIPDPDEGE